MFHLGLIGRDLSHSFSKNYFDEKFERENIHEFDYNLFEIDKISDIQRTIKNYSLTGFNVTIPYKEEIIPYCTYLSAEAEAIGAVNCVFMGNGRMIGHNTDCYGFLNSLPDDLFRLNFQAIIFGTGGASKAIQYVLKKLNVKMILVSTSRKIGAIGYDQLSKNIIHQSKLLVNCTPLGTSPNIDSVVPIDFSAISSDHLCYDLVYNPGETLFIKKAKLQGARCINGLRMLELQAEAAWNFWIEKINIDSNKV